MSTNTKKRNDEIASCLRKLNKAAKVKVDDSGYSAFLDALFSTDNYSFREIALVVIVAMKLDPKYRASKDFYACKPRAIYEGPIKDYLVDKNIPHTQSGPLNIAKSTQALNEDWASKRSPMEAGYAVLGLVTYLEDHPEDIDGVGAAIFKHLRKHARKIVSLNIDPDPQSDPDQICRVAFGMIEKAPDSGNTLQSIAAALVDCYYGEYPGFEILGADDNASTTNASGKKPGDVVVLDHKGRIRKVFEFTTKSFDKNRIRDSYDSIKNSPWAEEVGEVLVVCRHMDCPKDMKSSGGSTYLGTSTYRDITYRYLSVYEWIMNLVCELSPESRKEFYKSLNESIQNINTSSAVKATWKELNSAA